MTYVNAPIHDLLIRIKNAYMARKTSVESVPFSNYKVKILELLKQYGFVQNFEIKEDGKKKSMNIKLKKVIDPVNDVPNIKFFSRPSRPWYVSYKDITLVAG
jgi:small subunit ribosomal protein S8